MGRTLADRIPSFDPPMTTFPIRSTRSAAWGMAQWGAVMVLGMVLTATMLRPQPTMRLFWNVVVPLLPLSFLVTPVLWRAVCPLATLNMASSRAGGRRLSGTFSRWAGLPAVALLLALVPARHLAFNDHPAPFVALVVVAGVLALVSGRFFEARAGFCNLLCPILPVERLYGQQPLASIGNPRCPTCAVCTPRGCPELAAEKTLAQLLGPSRKTTAWIKTVTGIFACAFPGFIVGYFRVTPGSDALTTYGTVLAWTLGSATLGALLATWLRVPARPGLPILAALAAGAYFWCAAVGSLATLGVTSPVTLGMVRALLLLVVASWLARTLRAPRREVLTPWGG